MHLQTRQSRRTNRMPRKVDKRKTLCTSEFEPVYFKSQKSWQRNKWFQLVANNLHLQTRQARRTNRMPRTVYKRKTLYTSEFEPVYLESQESLGKETSGFNSSPAKLVSHLLENNLQMGTSSLIYVYVALNWLTLDDLWVIY